MASQDSSLESGGDVEVERRDLHSMPKTILIIPNANTNSEMVPKHLLQHDHSRSLQLLCSRHLGCNELSRCRRSPVAPSSQRWQCIDLLPHGR
jgi:hypothetical protein